jgi:hypothetical protein
MADTTSSAGLRRDAIGLRDAAATPEPEAVVDA